ncbi:MAG: DUF3365 domain-containing protein [Acidobacteriota bacterium]
MRHFKRLKIIHQAAWVTILIWAAVASSFLFWAAENTRDAELAHSRTVADMADSLRTMVARHGGVYVRRQSDQDVGQVGRYLAEYAALPTFIGEPGPSYVFHQKNPFLALADYSQEVQQSPAAAKFRITSDNMMNPANRPDLFDLEALSVMRETGVKEYWKVQGDTLRFARALRAEPACLACHGKAEEAPVVVRMKYKAPDGHAKGGGYGYALGEVVGVTSVTVPHTTFGTMLSRQSWGFWLSVCVVLGLTIWVFRQLMKGVVLPLSRLSRYADEIAHSDDLRRVRQPRFDMDEASSRNEIHQQSFALKALHESMRTAVDHITRTDR